MVAAAQRTTSTEGSAGQRSTHAGVSVGLVRKDRRGMKSPLSLDVTLDKLERMCISSAGRHGSSRRSLDKAEWLSGSSPTTILARRRTRIGATVLQSIDVPVILVESIEDINAPHAPRSGGTSKWGYLSSAVRPVAVPAISTCIINVTQGDSSSASGSSKDGSSPFLGVNGASPTPSP